MVGSGMEREGRISAAVLPSYCLAKPEKDEDAHLTHTGWAASSCLVVSIATQYWQSSRGFSCLCCSGTTPRVACKICLIKQNDTNLLVSLSLNELLPLRKEFLFVEMLLVDSGKKIVVIKLINFTRFPWIIQCLSILKATVSYLGTAT